MREMSKGRTVPAIQGERRQLTEAERLAGRAMARWRLRDGEQPRRTIQQITDWLRGCGWWAPRAALAAIDIVRRALAETDVSEAQQIARTWDA